MLWWTITAAELRRGWLIRRRYPLDLLFSIAGGIIFLVTVVAGAMAFTGGRVSLDPGWAPRIWGLVLGSMAASSLGAGVGYISQHSSAGTLEQVALSPVPLPGLILLKALTSLVTSAPYLIVYGAGLAWLYPGFRPPAILLASVLITSLGMIGLGLIVTGLALLFRQIQSVLGLITMLFYPLPLLAPAELPGALLGIPYGLGLHVALTGQLPLLSAVAITAAWLALGYLVLSWADRTARRKGVLGLY